MKKALKGFTLIECLVALAILAIASLTMAQIYAGVASANLKNHNLNASMSNQTSFIEKQIKNDGVNEFTCTALAPAGDPNEKTPPHKYFSDNKVTSSYIEFVEYDSSGNTTGNIYSYPVDVYLLKSRDKNNKDSSDSGYSGAEESELDLRYKFFTAH